MQHGSLIGSGRKRGPDVWQFLWVDRGPCGKRIYRKRVIGTVCQYPDQIGTTLLEGMAGTTRLELATSAVTGQRSNQLNYVPSCVSPG
jgi:hypothetical protein